VVLVAAACATGPSPQSSLYSLAEIDGRPLPTGSKDLPEDYLVLAGSLDFGLGNGLVRRSETFRPPNQAAESHSIELNYTRDKSVVVINLCPPLALCFARTELVGSASGSDLLLTHELGGRTQSTYRYRRSTRPR
jgi:hypothetical protein